jgi:hypothetical protein
MVVMDARYLGTARNDGRQGLGLRTLAHRLDEEAIAPPRPRGQRGRAASWAPSAIREMLRNAIYRGLPSIPEEEPR